MEKSFDNEALSNALTIIKDLETHRANEMLRIETVRLEMQLDYETKRIELISKNKESFLWLEEVRADLRKELVSFQKKYLPEIHTALVEGKVPEDLIHQWLTDVSKLYLNDINLSSNMIAVDIDEIKQDIFREIIEGYENRLSSLLKNLSNKLEDIIIGDLETESETVDINSDNPLHRKFSEQIDDTTDSEDENEH